MFVKENIIHFHQFTGLPWWAILMFSGLFVRACIFPLILVQMKRISKIGPIWPVLLHLKEGWKHSSLSTPSKLLHIASIYRMVSKQ